jgi:hypothetical protein
MLFNFNLKEVTFEAWMLVALVKNYPPKMPGGVVWFIIAR